MFKIFVSAVAIMTAAFFLFGGVHVDGELVGGWLWKFCLFLHELRA